MAGLVFVPPVQAVEGGSADCDALDVALEGAFLDTVFLSIFGGTDTVVAPDPANGTNDGGLGGTIDVPGIGGSVSIDLLTCEATRAVGFLSADADIASGAVTLGGVDVVTLQTITSEVLCPAEGTGAPTASASAGLTVGGEVINLSTDGLLSADATVDFSVLGLLDGVITVSAATSASADDVSATATGLELVLVFSGAVLGESVVLTLGTITLAETNCIVGAPDGGGPTTTSPGGGGSTTTSPGGGGSTTTPGGGGPGAGPGGELPATGGESGQVAVVAFATLAAGAAAIALARRRRPA